MTYYTSIPIINDRSTRKFDSASLKNLRKKLDMEFSSQEEIDQITEQLMVDCAEVCVPSITLIVT